MMMISMPPSLPPPPPPPPPAAAAGAGATTGAGVATTGAGVVMTSVRVAELIAAVDAVTSTSIVMDAIAADPPAAAASSMSVWRNSPLDTAAESDVVMSLKMLWPPSDTVVASCRTTIVYSTSTLPAGRRRRRARRDRRLGRRRGRRLRFHAVDAPLVHVRDVVVVLVGGGSLSRAAS